MRLVGLAAITAAVTSDAFYSSADRFPRQVATAIPALLHSLEEADIHIVTNE
jgi:protein EFR3